MAAGFIIDASEAEALMKELAAKHAVLLADVKRVTLAAGRSMRQTARSLSKSQSMPGLSNSIDTKTKQTVAGIEVTIEAKSPWGYGREFGMGRSGPHPFMLPALEQGVPPWEAQISEVTGKALS
jgi:hypothetical protein